MTILPTGRVFDWMNAMDDVRKDSIVLTDPELLVAAVEVSILDLIDRDVAARPEVLVPLDEDLLAKLRELTAGMDIDLDAPIEADDDCFMVAIDDNEEPEDVPSYDPILIENMNWLADRLAKDRLKREEGRGRSPLGSPRSTCSDAPRSGAQCSPPA